MNQENIKGVMEVLNSDARNAMHAIVGFLELVCEGPLTAHQREHIEACRVAVDRHFRGIEDARVILGLVPEERPLITMFAPSELFERVTEAVGVTARRRGVGLFCKIDSNVPSIVSADAEHIGHTLLRIAQAVISSMKRGDVHINLRAEPAREGFTLTFELLVPKRLLSPVLMLALQDDNFKFDSALPGSEVLGLAAARNLAIALGGRVEASASAAAGTRIAIILPVAPVIPDEEFKHRTHNVPFTDIAPLRILVAEDSEDSFNLFKAYLKSEPHTITRALNGAEAVEFTTAESFDLVFMDIRMPVMDGYDATKRIRDLETGKDRARLPIVVLSAEDLRAQRRQGGMVGCSGYLSKPLQKRELLEAIRVYTTAKFLEPIASIPIPSH